MCEGCGGKLCGGISWECVCLWSGGLQFLCVVSFCLCYRVCIR